MEAPLESAQWKEVVPHRRRGSADREGTGSQQTKQHAGGGGKARAGAQGLNLQQGPHVPTSAISAARASCSPRWGDVTYRGPWELLSCSLH